MIPVRVTKTEMAVKMRRQGANIKAISDALSTPEDTIRVLLNRARKRGVTMPVGRFDRRQGGSAQ
jgi:hypothetical protein